MNERRDSIERARTVAQILAVLRAGDAMTLRDLARAAGEIPENIAARVLKRLALRGLARNVSEGWWRGTALLRVEPLLKACSGSS
jgi:hypothetical protein